MGKFTKYMFSGGSWLASEDMTFEDTAMVYGRVTSALQQHSLTAFPCWLGIDIIEMTAEEAGTLDTAHWWVHWWWSPVPGQNIINYLQTRYNNNNNNL